MKNIIIAGASGHGKVIIDIVEKEGRFKVIGLVDTYKDNEKSFYGYPIVGTEHELPALIDKYSIVGGIITIGVNWIRGQMMDKILENVPGFQFVSAIHPSAQIARGAKIGKGTVIMGGVIVNSDTVIGDHCILNTNASVDHDCVMEDFSSLAPRASIGGNVKIGPFSAICLGANVIHGISIGEHSIIGSGATVLSDIESYSVAYGTPAKIVRKRKEGDKYY